MADPMSVFIDGTMIVQYDRNKPLPGIQRRALDQIDARLANGFKFAGQQFSESSVEQRAQFVANSLVNALLADNDNLVAALSAWLATRMPTLRRVVAKNDANGMMIDLVTQGSFDPLAEQHGGGKSVEITLDALSTKPH